VLGLVVREYGRFCVRGSWSWALGIFAGPTLCRCVSASLYREDVLQGTTGPHRGRRKNGRVLREVREKE
jgi:hypothetical protein